MGNLNLGLHFNGNLYEGARAWYFNVVGGTEARFNLSQKVPNSYVSLRFCAWYVISDSVPDYNINNTCIKKIKAMFQAKKGSKSTHMKGMGEFLQAEREADPTGAHDTGNNQLRSLIKGAHGELRSILNLSLLRLVRVRRRLGENS